LVKVTPFELREALFLTTQSRRQRPGGGGPATGLTREELVRNRDLDGDGTISKSEADLAPRALAAVAAADMLAWENSGFSVDASVGAAATSG